jgi:transposase
MSDVPCFVGMDVAQAPWDMAWRPSGERWAVPNAPHGCMTLVERLQAVQPTLIVLEATGGLERAATAAVATAGRPVVVVHPRQARDVARAPGQLAKPEVLEARALAHCADVIRPTPRPLPDTQTQERRALLGRRQPRIGMRTAAQHRLAGTTGYLAKALEAQMTWLNARLATLDDDLETRLRASPVWREHDDWLQSAPGLGPVGTRTLLLERPEWGTLTRQQVAALGGVAPLHCASGTLRGRRMIGGGRAHGRTVWYRGTLGATRYHPQLKAVDERLWATGKVKKVALTACRRTFWTILNAMRKHRTPWPSQEVQG